MNKKSVGQNCRLESAKKIVCAIQKAPDWKYSYFWDLSFLPIKCIFYRPYKKRVLMDANNFFALLYCNHLKFCMKVP